MKTGGLELRVLLGQLYITGGVAGSPYDNGKSFTQNIDKAHTAIIALVKSVVPEEMDTTSFADPVEATRRVGCNYFRTELLKRLDSL